MISISFCWAKSHRSNIFFSTKVIYVPSDTALKNFLHQIWTVIIAATPLFNLSELVSLIFKFADKFRSLSAQKARPTTDNNGGKGQRQINPLGELCSGVKSVFVLHLSTVFAERLTQSACSYSAHIKLLL